MKKIWLLSVLILGGCGHNAMIYTSGTFINLGYDPQLQKVGIQFMNGEMVGVGTKENTNIEVDLMQKTGVNGTSISDNRISKIKYSTGIQINGYVVDMVENNPELGKALILEMLNAGKVTKYYTVKDKKLIETTKDDYVIKIDGNNQSVDMK